MKHKRLGRGLDALIPQLSPEEEAARGDLLSEIEVTKIRPNPFQPRMEFDTEHLEELKQSVSENGIIQPITVRKADDGFELIAGERRLRVVQELGFARIPAYVMEVDSEDQMLELSLVENIQRENLNPIELAKAYHRLQKEYGLTQEAVAQKVGKDRATVANCIRLLKLPESIQESLRRDEISMGHARALMGLPTRGKQIHLWKKIVKNGWSVRKVEETVRKTLETVETAGGQVFVRRDPFLSAAEDRLRSYLGTQVRIKTSGRGGKIEIAYYSDQDLDRILDLVAK